MAACYLPDDHPNPASSLVAPSIKALLKDIPVRSTHADTKSTLEKKMPKPNLQGHDTMHTSMQFLNFFNLMMQKARNMDDLKIEYNNAGQKSSDTAQVPTAGATVMALQTSSPCNTPCNLDKGDSIVPKDNQAQTVPAQTLPAITNGPEDAQAAGCQPSSNANDLDMSLQDYEVEAFKRLQAKKHGKDEKGDSKAKKPRKSLMKRPAAKTTEEATKSKQEVTTEQASSSKVAKCKAATKTTGVAKTIGKTKPAGKDSPKTLPSKNSVLPKKQRDSCWGCSRCRGDPFGCDSCAFKAFKGLRLNGRDAWRKWWNKKKCLSEQQLKLLSKLCIILNVCYSHKGWGVWMGQRTAWLLLLCRGASAYGPSAGCLQKRKEAAFFQPSAILHLET